MGIFFSPPLTLPYVFLDLNGVESEVPLHVTVKSVQTDGDVATDGFIKLNTLFTFFGQPENKCVLIKASIIRSFACFEAQQVPEGYAWPIFDADATDMQLLTQNPFCMVIGPTEALLSVIMMANIYEEVARTDNPLVSPAFRDTLTPPNTPPRSSTLNQEMESNHPNSPSSTSSSDSDTEALLLRLEELSSNANGELDWLAENPEIADEMTANLRRLLEVEEELQQSQAVAFPNSDRNSDAINNDDNNNDRLSIFDLDTEPED